jgi:hypothetical protein
MASEEMSAVEQTPTLILSQRYGADAQVLWRAATARGWNVERPVRYTLNTSPLGPVGVYGELTFCDIMAERLMLGLLDPPDTWLADLPQKYLKREVRAGTVADLPSLKSRAFIKPANDKVFHAGIYQYGKDVPIRYVEPSCPILISEIAEFNFEVRLYILDRKVVTASHYLVTGLFGTQTRESMTTEAIDWAADLLAEPKLDLPSAVVVDVGYSNAKGWSVVEANQLYASGVYESADPDKLLDAILRAGGPLEAVSNKDHKYLRNHTCRPAV